MRTTFKEVIYNVKNIRGGGKQSQDALLSDAQYAFIIDYYRQKLIERDYERGKQLAPQVEQTVEGKLVREKSAEIDIFGEHKVFRVDIPRIIQTTTKPLYTGVRASLLSKTIARSTTARIRYDLQSGITKDAPRYFPMGDNLYIVTPDPMQKLFISGVFERPILVREFEGKLDPFDPYNFDYQMSMGMLDTLYKMMTDAELKISAVLPVDTKADGNEERGGTVPRQRVENEG